VQKLEAATCSPRFPISVYLKWIQRILAWHSVCLSTENISRSGMQLVTQEFWKQTSWYWFHPRLGFASKAPSYIARSSPATIMSWASRSMHWSRIGPKHLNSGNPDNLNLEQGGGRMPSLPVPQSRRSRRIAMRKRASLVINLERKPKRLPLPRSRFLEEGFRLREKFRPQARSGRTHPR
jgi:hypothetical protein